jgi:hypothetical protein
MDHGWLQIKLRLFNERIKSLQDWIVIADSDEFHDFDALGPGIQVAWVHCRNMLTVAQPDLLRSNQFSHKCAYYCHLCRCSACGHVTLAAPGFAGVCQQA